MGRDKALLEFHGQPLVALALEKLRVLGIDPKICGAAPGSTAVLARFAEVIPDNFPGSGPLAGVEAGLGLAVGNSAQSLFLAVDMPLLPVQFLRWLIARGDTSEAAATIPVAAGRDQPLCAVYSRRLLDGIRGAIAAGHLKMMTAVEEAAASLGESVDRFQIESVAPTLPPGLGPSGTALRDWFLNTNTREEFARVRDRAGKQLL